MRRKTLHAIALVATVGTVGVGAALATPGSGILGAPILARGTLDDRVKIKPHEPSDVIVQQVTLAPGGSTGWHTHPGPAVVIVKSGSFTLYDGGQQGDRDDDDGHDGDACAGTTYSGGEVFFDSGYGNVHIGRNEGSTNTELYVTYLDVPVGAAPRIDVPNPGNCPF